MPSLYLPGVTPESAERTAKQRAIELWDQNWFPEIEDETLPALKAIHHYLFQEVFPFAGILRTEDVDGESDLSFPGPALTDRLELIATMPERSVNALFAKVIELGKCRPFLQGNGITIRMWLNLMLSRTRHQIVDWSQVQKPSYLRAKKHSEIGTYELSMVLMPAMTTDTENRERYLRSVDSSFYFSGWNSVSIFTLDAKCQSEPEPPAAT